MNNYKAEKPSRTGVLMGNFFSEILSCRGNAGDERVKSVVEATIVMLDQVEEIPTDFKEFLKYVIKKSGEQRKMELRFERKYHHAIASPR